MKEEYPSVIPDYNTKPAETGFLKKFIKAPVDIDGFYTPFWPLFIVFGAYTFLLLYEVSFLNTKNLMLLQQRSGMVDPTPKFKEQRDFINIMNKELQALAPTDPAAAAILRDFFPTNPADAGKAPADKPKN